MPEYKSYPDFHDYKITTRGVGIRKYKWTRWIPFFTSGIPSFWLEIERLRGDFNNIPWNRITVWQHIPGYKPQQINWHQGKIGGPKWEGEVQGTFPIPRQGELEFRIQSSAPEYRDYEKASLLIRDTIFSHTYIYFGIASAVISGTILLVIQYLLK